MSSKPSNQPVVPDTTGTLLSKQFLIFVNADSGVLNSIVTSTSLIKFKLKSLVLKLIK